MILDNRFINRTWFLRISCLVFFDVLAITLSLYAAVETRFARMDFFSFLEKFTGGTIISYISYLLSFYLFNLYDFKADYRKKEIPVYSLLACAAGAVLVAFFSFAIPNWKMWRSLLLLQSVILSVFMLFRFQVLQRLIRTRFVTPKRVLMAGNNHLARDMALLLSGEHDGEYEVAGCVGDPEEGSGLIYLGTYDQIRSRVEEKKIDTIITCAPQKDLSPISAELLHLKSQGCDVVEMPVLYSKLTGKVPIHLIGDEWFVYGPLFSIPRSALFQNAMRLLDMTLAGMILVLSLPVWMLCFLMIKITMPGPVFYLQTRVGLHSRPFRIIKFRSMKVNAEAASGPVWARGTSDRRITLWGAIMRRTRMDELPQLINVLKGDMSLIGPRPERPYFVSKLIKKIPYYGLRFSVKPGVTGWAQVKMGYAGDEKASIEKLQYDLFYIQQNSIALNLIILLKTIQTILTKPGS